MKKVLLLFIPALLVGTYTAFVAMCMWNWFVVTALNLPTISYLQMLGLIWLIGLVTDKANPDGYKWKVLLTTVNSSLPDEKREAVSEALQDLNDNLWVDMAGLISGQLIGNTITLFLSYILHLFI